MREDAQHGESDEDPAEPLLRQAEGLEVDPAASQEFLSLATAGWPLSTKELSTYGTAVLELGIVGRLGSPQQAVFVLSRTLTNITGLTYLNGVTGAVDTLCAQAHGGALDRGTLGVVLQRAVLFTLLCTLPVLGLYTQLARLLVAAGQDAVLAAAAQRYVLLYCGFLPLHGAALCADRYLMAQGAVMPALAAGLAFLAATPALNWLLVFRLGLGLDGSALAGVAANAVYLAALAVAVAAHNAAAPPGRRPWQGLSRQALEDWGHYTRLALASLLLTGLDWWTFDLTTFLAGLLPEPELALSAIGLAANVNTLGFTVTLGLSYVVCAHVGGRLGAGRWRAARLAAQVGLASGLGVTASLAAAWMAASRQVGRLLSSDAAVLRGYSALVAPAALCMVANGGTAMLAGALRGCRRQAAGAKVNAAVNWVLGLGLEVLLAFRLGLGARGLWWGLCGAGVAQLGALAWLVCRFDWAHERDRAGRLVRRLSRRLEQRPEGLP